MEGFCGNVDLRVSLSGFEFSTAKTVSWDVRYMYTHRGNWTD